jgi:SAM-dependent methyltransferase
MKSIISFLIRTIPRKYLQLFAHLLMKIVALFYSGNQVQCNICEHSYRKFLPYGRKGRDNALCPNCLALERHRLMWLYLQEKTNFFEAPLKVLHIAPEHCFIQRMEGLKHLDYLTADLESPLAKVKMDIHHMPFEDNTFDVVFCNHVLEHVNDDIRACQEIKRVLKPKGWGILQSPVYDLENTIEDPKITDSREREKIFGQADHVRKYGRDYAKRLSVSGLSVQENFFVKELDPQKVIQHALPENEILFLCSKSIP